MKTIVVDDEQYMLKSFRRNCEGIDSICIEGEFMYPEDALQYAKENAVELAVLDISMPQMTGIELAGELRKIRPDILIVFISAYDNYLRESNEIGADYYIVKPYKKETVRQMAQKMELLSKRLQKDIFIHTFGRFTITRSGKPVPLTGKSKEILALIVTRRGKEISNEEIYSTIWENRPYGNVEMKVYYNAVARLKKTLAEEGLSGLLISTTRGQIINTEMFDCDYYDWLDRREGKFNGEFLTEYSWGEDILAEMMDGLG